jgi:hypothetical protein
MKNKLDATDQRLLRTKKTRKRLLLDTWVRLVRFVGALFSLADKAIVFFDKLKELFL